MTMEKYENRAQIKSHCRDAYLLAVSDDLKFADHNKHNNLPSADHKRTVVIQYKGILLSRKKHKIK